MIPEGYDQQNAECGKLYGTNDTVSPKMHYKREKEEGRGSP